MSSSHCSRDKSDVFSWSVPKAVSYIVLSLERTRQPYPLVPELPCFDVSSVGKSALPVVVADGAEVVWSW